MNEAPHAASSEDLSKIGKLIDGIKVAMLTTAAADGSLRSRPMATQEVEFDGVLWFFTDVSSPKVDEVREDQHVNVSYSDPSGNRYVSMSGRARVVRDPAKVRELWSPVHKAWFPKGPEDPSIGLLRVEVT